MQGKVALAALELLKTKRTFLGFVVSCGGAFTWLLQGSALHELSPCRNASCNPGIEAYSR